MANDDIYRGIAPPRTPPPSVHSLPSSTSSTSSSGSSDTRARLGALAAVVENAITRWAKRRGPPSSSSNSTLSHSSIVATVRSAKRSRRSRGSSFHSSERHITARIALVKARKESRQVPRQFALYSPTLHENHCPGDIRPLTVTDSLPLILNKLDSTFRKSHRTPHMTQTKTTDVSISPTSAVGTESAVQFASTSSHGGARKGKARAHSHPANGQLGVHHRLLKPKAWYLDVASPSWEDLRALGNLLHLHPLTLEDILQNEAREKLEIFPRLGYYFVSFRAIGTRTSWDRMQHESNDDAPLHEVGEANIYLTVFKHGICTFHFTDISEHTRRVRNRINRLEETLNLSSDWIVYETLDSIVDSFFPYLHEIEEEVVEIDKLVFSRNQQPSSEGSDLAPSLTTNLVNISEVPEKVPCEDTVVGMLNEKAEVPCKEQDGEDIVVGMLDEKAESKASNLTRAPSKKLPVLELWRRFRSSMPQLKLAPNNIAQNSKSTLRRIARVRRLVTSLNRSLATKYEVAAHIRKRLLIDSRSGMGIGTSSDSVHVAMYMGDMQDHIYTLQHSLDYYERMLSHLHPTYLSQLRTDAELTGSSGAKALMYLSVVTVAVLCIHSYVGIFSMNINLPHNTRDPSGSYHVFAFVMATSILILVVCGVVVGWWWKQAKLLHRTNL